MLLEKLLVSRSLKRKEDYFKMCPCKGCDDRYIGCHGKCDKYKEYRDKLDATKAVRIKNICDETALYRAKVAGMRRMQHLRK